jgi:type II secretion system protein I
MRNKRDGFTLLEVLISIAILGLSMIAIGHLFNLGIRNAIDVRLRSEANIIADATMAELAAGVIDASGGGGIVESNPDWQYSVRSQSSDQPGLLVATVVIQRRNDPDQNVSISLVRFIADPDYEPEQDQQ